MSFNRCVYPCVIIDVLADVWVEVITINVRAGVVIGAVSDMQVDVTINEVSDIGVEGLTDVNANLLVAAMAALQFVMPSPG